MDFEANIANWVLEFYLRQPLECRTLNSLLRALPVPTDNPNLQKLLLLKKLEFEALRRPISEGALELMERLEEIEFQRGKEAVSGAMRRAYFAVAVDCTLRRLKVGKDGGRSYEFFEMVKRVWRGRIGRMAEVSGGLGSELLWEWKEMIEKAVWDDGVCESVLKKFEGVSAVEAVRVYVKEEREKMGPSFLELVAKTVKNEEGLLKVIGGDGIDRTAVNVAENGSNPNKEMLKRRIKLKIGNKVVGLRNRKEMSSSNPRAPKTVDSDGTVAGPSCSNYHSIRGEEVEKALELSSMELQAAVEDPLPDALRVAEEISDEETRSKQDEPAIGNDGRPQLFIVDAAGVVRSSGGNTNDVRKRSLMERNSSARTYEWDDDANDGSQEDGACRAVLQIPSPKRMNISPLRMCEMNNLKKRRKGRRWTPMEEDTLRAGVETHGKGNWKLILTAYRDVFEGRTEVDLKDKWRNLTRYSKDLES